MLKFITGNKQKFEEVKRFLHPLKIEQVKMDLNEIQGLDPFEVVKHKLSEAFKHHKGEFLIDDESVYLYCLGGKLPGPLIKWFNVTIGPRGLFDICRKMNNYKAFARSIIGYAKSPKEVLFFEGKTKGRIVSPKGLYKFGYDPIFAPENLSETFAQLKSKGKFELSPRYRSVTKLKKHLLKRV